MPAIDVLGAKHRDKWEEFTRTCQEATFFHTFDSWQLLRLGYPSEVARQYWGLWLNDKIVAIWPTSLIPTLGGSVLRARPPATIKGIDVALLRSMLNHITNETRKQGALRWSVDIPETSPFVKFASHLQFELKPSAYCTYTLDTSVSSDVLWKQLASEARTAVRKARKLGLEVGEPQDPEELSTFLSIYQSTMERCQLVDAFPLRSGAIPLLSFLIGQGKAKLFTAIDGDRMVAGIFLLLHKQSALWWLGGSMQDSWKMRPNELLLWHAIEWASNSRFRELDLGGTPSGQTHGLNLFKRHLGGERVDLVHLTLPINRLKDSLATAVVRTGRKLRDRRLVPGWLVNLVSKRLFLE